MNILVLNGSPKGANSITYQTIRYIEKLCPKHTFEVLHVGHRIKALEKDFTPAKETFCFFPIPSIPLLHRISFTDSLSS